MKRKRILIEKNRCVRYDCYREKKTANFEAFDPISYIVGHFGGFPLRLSWLPRLIDRYAEVGRVPSNLETLACELGVGKNMAKSMRAWGRAARMIHDDGHISDMAKRLFVTHDPYLERGESLALLHWLIASNSQRFTAGAWVFNNRRGEAFTLRDAVSGFKDYLASNNAIYADGTLRGDMEPVLRMHSAASDSHSEEYDDRFFSQLRLLAVKRTEGRSVYKRTWRNERSHVSAKLLLHALLRTLAERATASSALSELYMASAGHAAPGAIFGFSRDGFFSAVERLDRNGSGGLSLSTMPGQDALLTARTDFGRLCAASNTEAIDSWFFGKVPA